MQTDNSTTTFQRPGQPQSLQNNKRYRALWQDSGTIPTAGRKDTDFISCLQQDHPSLPRLWLQYKPRADAGRLKFCTESRCRPQQVKCWDLPALCFLLPASAAPAAPASTCSRAEKFLLKVRDKDSWIWIHNPQQYLRR